MPRPVANVKDDLLVLSQGKPYIRSVLAFIVYLAKPGSSRSGAYIEADKFIEQLEKDVKDNE